MGFSTISDLNKHLNKEKQNFKDFFKHFYDEERDDEGSVNGGNEHFLAVFLAGTYLRTNDIHNFKFWAPDYFQEIQNAIKKTNAR